MHWFCRFGVGLLILGLGVACQSESTSSSSDSDRVPATDTLPANVDAELYQRGQAIFERTCKTCHPRNLMAYIVERHHTEKFERSCQTCHPRNPPPLEAPHVQEIAAFYRESFHDSSTAIDAMAQFMAEPDSGASKLDSTDLARWGLMPPPSLSDSARRAVAYWLWEQYTPN